MPAGVIRFRWPPIKSPIRVRVAPPVRNCQPLIVTGFSVLAIFLIRLDAIAPQKADKSSAPSPLTAKLPSSIDDREPPVTHMITPRKPMMLPRAFRAVIFSNLKTATARKILKNVPAALMIEPLTPDVWASPR